MIDNIYSDVFCLVKQEERDKALREIISSCSIFSSLPETLDKFSSSVIRRERVQSTDIGHGVAIAHGKVAHLDRTIIALGYSPSGIQFKENSERVHFVFVIASPLSSSSDYLASVALLLSWLHNDSFRKEFSSCKETKHVKSFLDMLKSQKYISLDI